VIATSDRSRGTEQVGQHLACFSQIAFRERGYVRGLLRSHVDRPCTTRNMSNEAGGGQCPELPYHLGFSQATSGLVLWVLLAMNEVNE
jgi:hypothetical protein